MSQQGVCPVVGTTNSVLPPSHPDVDLSKPGQTCPVVGAKTDHHTSLHKHPSVAVPGGATSAREVSRIVDQPRSSRASRHCCAVTPYDPS